MIRRSRIPGTLSLASRGPRRSVFSGALWPSSGSWWEPLRVDAPLLIARDTMVGADGSACASMKDAVTGNVVATAAGAARPTLTATGASFNGTGNAMSLAYANASHAYTFVAVVTPDTVAGTQTLLGANADESVSHAVGGYVEIHDGTLERTGMQSTARKQLLMVTVDPATHLVSYYRDGVLLATATYDDSWSWGASPVIGAAYGAAAGFFDGVVHCLAIVPSVLSAARRAVWASTLMAEYSLAFSPLSVASVDGWWRGDVGVTGNPVSAWVNQGPTGNALAGAGGPAVSVLNGQPSMLYNDVATKLAYSGAIGDFTFMHNGSGATTILVAKPTATGVLCSTDTLNAGRRGSSIASTAANSIQALIGNGTGVFLVTLNGTGSFPLGTAKVVTLRAATASTPQADLRVAGTSVASSAFTGAPAAGAPDGALTTGAQPGGSAVYGGELAEVLVYSRYLSALETAAVEAYMSTRYGL